MDRGIEQWKDPLSRKQVVKCVCQPKGQLGLLQELKQAKSRYATSWRNIFELHVRKLSNR